MTSKQKAKVGSPGALWALALICACTVATLLALRPRPVVPRQVIHLVLNGAEVDECLSEDRARESQISLDEFQTIRDLYRAVASQDPSSTAQIDAQRLAQLASELPADKRAALRSAATNEMERALRFQVSDEERTQILKGFLTTLSRYGLVTSDKNAPIFVARALFKAAWNHSHGFPATDGFVQVELEAYWGWLAFETEELPSRRIAALIQYEEVVQREYPGTRGYLFYLGNAFEQSTEAYKAATESHASFRERNYGLAAVQALTE